MAKNTLLRILHQPVHPVFAVAILFFVTILGIMVFLMSIIKFNPQAEKSPIIPKTTQTCLPMPPTPTLAPGQKALYTFYIQATSNQSSQELVLSQSDTGKVFTADIGTLIILQQFGISNSHISHVSPQDIFKNFGSPETIHLPNNALGAFRVYRAGCGTITVYGTNPTFPSPPPHTTYTSDNLGISFSYLTGTNAVQKFFTKEIGDTVYLYWIPATNQPFSGSDAEFLQKIAPGAYSVEVFSKDPNLSLADAIKQRFLTGYSEADCFINTNYRKGYPRDDMSFVTAAITANIPKYSNLSFSQISDYIEKCPGGYTEGGRGILYFMMDPKHPNKMLFVKIGQSNIPSGVGGLWDGTLKVF